MKVSVIIPVYNRLEHLRAGFICLLNQTVTPTELIITDDGSSEKVTDYIGDLIKYAKFEIKHIIQVDKGFRKTRALNNAVKNSKGDLLIFCDQDLIFPEDYVEKMINEAKHGEFLLGRAHNTTREEKEKILETIDLKIKYKAIENIVDRKYLSDMEWMYKKDRQSRRLKRFYLSKRGIRLAGMSYCIYKEDYIKVNGYDEQYQGWGYEDDDFGNRLTMVNVIGREFKTKLIQLHLYHNMDSTKKKSLNEEYYYKRKKEIFKYKDFYCKYGYTNSIDKDNIIINILKRVR
ncbi:glycosyltransferase [Fusobacterium sp. IOR10]|uniref:glycosyltransferase n=1 Tax=Fusobacterium sp. IOR10 TaxID=2665157 RepID=UPI0013D07D6B|nr:glycosyltransferase [Fusobacterium sp. IOR10]